MKTPKLFNMIFIGMCFCIAIVAFINVRGTSYTIDMPVSSKPYEFWVEDTLTSSSTSEVLSSVTSNSSSNTIPSNMESSVPLQNDSDNDEVTIEPPPIPIKSIEIPQASSVDPIIIDYNGSNADWEENEQDSVTSESQSSSEQINPPPQNPDSEEEYTGMVNINTATLEMLCSLDGIGEVTAQKIIDFRTVNGGFQTIEDIMLVSGIGDKKYNAIKSRLTV